PGMKNRESKVLGMLSTLLSGGGSSRLSMKMVDAKKTAIQVAAYNMTMEDQGMYITLALPNGGTALNDLLADIDVEVDRVKTELISQKELTKLQNQFENEFVSANSSVIGIAENLANGYTFQDKNTSAINQELKIIQSITPEEIRDVARKYLNKKSRVVLYYLPKK
ncbi:MAG: insulinase family protein, partial [Chitinophagaceae bacterium]